MGTTTKTKPITFRSRGVSFKAVIKPSRRVQGDYGSEFVAGEYADFAPHGMFVTDDPKIIEHLRGLPTFNTEFYEVGNEPGQIPSSEPVIDRIMEAATELDDAALAQIEAEEQAGFKRPDIMTTVASARQRVQRLVEEQEKAGAGAGAPGGGS